MSLPQIVSRDEWLAAREELLAKEKELTRTRDALNAERRRLPMVQIEKDYRFTGPQGDVGLVDLFEGRLQLIVGHFMFNPSWTDGWRRSRTTSAARAGRSRGTRRTAATSTTTST
jgi:predicted dithiol-disulfide oxidoreductase (DUF899 family)